jgi:UDP-N-acetylglucosamine 2-epimerase (non-hydrolysing)/GDP/UDP-N,N'-diacetylbacillosamine 2-epimerase (hydrolysing)
MLQATAAEVVLLQGDRGEMLAGAIAAAHMNVPIVHMSGGDLSGTIDQPVRNAITQFAHVHLTSCRSSSERLRRLGEDPRRIFEVGEPSLDAILGGEYAGADELIRRFDLDPAMPVIMATLHPVTTEAAEAGRQMAALLDALEHLGMQTVFSYPNTDAGGLEMRDALEARRGRKWLRIEPHVGSRGYLGLMRIAAVLVGNSSSGILEAPSFRLPAVNIGTRQYGRERAANVIDVGYSRDDILKGLRTALEDADFRARVSACTSPYGDGRAGEKTAAILRRLRLSRRLVEKWLPSDDGFSD